MHGSPFCHSTVVVGAECCTSYSVVHLLCDEAGLRDVLQQLGIASVLYLLFWLKAIPALSKRYKGQNAIRAECRGETPGR